MKILSFLDRFTLCTWESSLREAFLLHPLTIPCYKVHLEGYEHYSTIVQYSFLFDIFQIATLWNAVHHEIIICCILEQWERLICNGVYTSFVYLSNHEIPLSLFSSDYSISVFFCNMSHEERDMEKGEYTTLQLAQGICWTTLVTV